MNGWSGHSMIDPSILESRFSTEDGMSFMDSLFDEPSDDVKAQIEKVMGILEELPPIEADFVELHYFKRRKQTDIAALYRCSQPTVHYRLKRAANRIKFLLELPQVCPRQMCSDLLAFLGDPSLPLSDPKNLDVRVMLGMFETTCQSAVAKQEGFTQGRIRHRFIRSLKKMRQEVKEQGEQSKMLQYVKLFEYIADNLIILREVQRPALKNRITYIVD